MLKHELTVQVLRMEHALTPNRRCNCFNVRMSLCRPERAGISSGASGIAGETMQSHLATMPQAFNRLCCTIQSMMPQRQANQQHPRTHRAPMPPPSCSNDEGALQQRPTDGATTPNTPCRIVESTVQECRRSFAASSNRPCSRVHSGGLHRLIDRTSIAMSPTRTTKSRAASVR